MDIGTVVLIALGLFMVGMYTYYFGPSAYDLVDKQQSYSPEYICSDRFNKGVVKLESIDLHVYVILKMKLHNYNKIKNEHNVDFEYELMGSGKSILGISTKGVRRYTFTDENWKTPITFLLKRNMRHKNLLNQSKHKLVFV